MTNRKPLNQKILLLGLDGMDPRLTRKYVDEGKMPNTAEFIKRGAARHDLVMLGGHPTVTPPMWTTLATGCYANVHGITDFCRIGGDIDKISYNFDSRFCKAEQLWNVTAEAGLKTLVWHWPGSAWPPSSDSENLYVVDGTSPGSVGMSVAQIEGEYLLSANVDQPEVTFRRKAASEANAACVITGLELEEVKEKSLIEKVSSLKSEEGHSHIITKFEQGTSAATENALDLALSPIKDAYGWTNAPEDAKEFTVVFSGGLIRRPSLILKGNDGKYNKVAIYKTKKDLDPIAILEPMVMKRAIQDEAIVSDKKFRVIRNLKVLELAEDGSKLSMYISPAMDIDNDTVYHPKHIYKDICENVGYPTPTSDVGCQSDTLITDCMLDSWYGNTDWQAEAIHYMIESEDIDVVFSHYHAIDLEEHMFIKHMADKPWNRNPVAIAERWMENLYKQADYYIGKFLDLLDDGWTVFIFSDHGQVATKHDLQLIGDPGGLNYGVMHELGYTYLKEDAQGNPIPEIDWTKTTAVANRSCNIHLNIKGRNQHKLPDGTVIDGIVDPEDQYELEEQIMTDLYGYRDKKTGKRVISVALRNKDAVLLGYGGPDCGDICYWLAEGYNFDHGDSLSTTYGEKDTSVSPIFIAAGTGIKEDFETERVIRQVDFVPTVAVVAGVRMPAQCEGAPVYQILTEEY
ncbi:MAG: alkaline phosphatase family protein [Peptococcaceae bacterium]|nr:alkaline phosphatase family protein [Peptococcaceae bacterium]